MQFFGITHLLCTLFNLFYQISNFIKSTCLISFYRLAKSFQSRLHIMKIRNCFKQWLSGYICERLLKISKCHSCPVCKIGIDLFVTLAILNKDCHTPVVAIAILIKKHTIMCRKQCKYPAFNITHNLLFKLGTNMACYSVYIILQLLYILKNIVVNTLQNILIVFLYYPVRIIYMTLTKWHYFDTIILL